MLPLRIPPRAPPCPGARAWVGGKGRSTAGGAESAGGAGEKDSGQVAETQRSATPRRNYPYPMIFLHFFGDFSTLAHFVWL